MDQKSRDSMEKLAAYERMQEAVKKGYEDTRERMERLKAQGKVKSVTYSQLMAQKLTYKHMLALYEWYDL